MSEAITGEFLRDSTEPPNVMEIHCSTMPFGNQSIMTVTIPGHVPYRELYRTHPDNTLITAFTLLRRVANDYAALLVKCSTTHEAAETPQRAGPYLNVDLKALVAELERKNEQLDTEVEEQLKSRRKSECTIAFLEDELTDAKKTIVKLQNQLGDTQDERNKLKVELEATCSEILSQAAQQGVKAKFGDEAGLARQLQDSTLEAFGDSLTDETTQREHRRDDLLRAALRVLGDLL